MTSDDVLLRLEGVTKRFGATLALNRVDFDLRAGEVHALVGENGAGKSTLMKILAGNEQRDAGRILVDGQDVEIRSPNEAARHGIAIIHQELNTVPTMTVAENLALGQEPRNWHGALDRRGMVRAARAKLARIAADIDPRRTLGTLSVGMQQMVEIARAVSEDARILVLDEPTAALSRAEAAQLYRLVGEMRRGGAGLVYITHRMEEVWQLADRITVFRDGAHIGTRRRDEVHPDDVVRMMVGRPVEDLYRHDRQRPGDTVLDVENLAGPGVGPVTFRVRAGEVVCLAGLIGSGRTEAARLVFGADRATAGTVRVRGRVVNARTPREGIRAGLAMVPESRKDQALFLPHSVEHNIAISSLDRLSSAGVLQRRRIRQEVTARMDRLRLRRSALRLPVRSLSGGNQQKAALARWLMREPDVLILDEPTRGVDIGAKREIYELVNELTERGKAVLVVSSDLPEAIGISDRILVMRAGRIVQELDSRLASEEDVMFHATGAARRNQGETHD
ncbi:sugar ABC transporter ATP-binding protein [Prauserella muralis]|uniref:D-xylose ABC transporter ATP-binding protein n=1 Tax=Prauserella muralis TaxID=588067 RepID=A0A2V4BCN6_9PSEU|nr:sugar ABC transporter ATP-binding protein [Prauserella muralis]PXY27369.1 D-xylose ABC transporter ATP-binding protein [Prauserella muralis]TWE22945.1 monosaccharide ABC transporter ATP-binding protein (CUT2 family) [Prauserella muralis]